MKAFNYFYLIMIFLLSLLFFSCSEDSTNPPGSTDYSEYYPLTVGSWWVYETWSTDENFVQDTLISRDSVVIVSKELYQGKNASVRITFDTFTGKAIDTSYEYFENNSVYDWDQLTPFTEEEGWIERGNFTKNKMTIIDTTVIDMGMDEFTSFSGKMKMEITKGSEKTVNLRNTDYTALTFDNTFNLDGTLTVPIYGEVTFTRDMTMTMFLVKNIGQAQLLVVTEQTALGKTDIEYSKQILTDWSIK